MIRGTIEGLLSVNVPYGFAYDHGLFYISHITQYKQLNIDIR